MGPWRVPFSIDRVPSLLLFPGLLLCKPSLRDAGWLVGHTIYPAEVHTILNDWLGLTEPSQYSNMLLYRTNLLRFRCWVDAEQTTNRYRNRCSYYSLRARFFTHCVNWLIILFKYRMAEINVKNAYFNRECLRNTESKNLIWSWSLLRLRYVLLKV